MNAMRGTYTNGKVVLDKPAEWPEGCRVVVEPAPAGEALGIREEDWHDTPEAVAEWLRWYDALEPLVLTPEEEAEWQAAHKAQKEYDLSRFEERARKIEDLFP